MKKTAQLSLVWLVFMAVAACLSGLWSEKARAIDLALALQAPSMDHLFGTDLLGRDVLLRMLSGGSVSLGVASGAMALSVLFGVLIGLVSGYGGGRMDRVLMGNGISRIAKPGTERILLSPSGCPQTRIANAISVNSDHPFGLRVLTVPLSEKAKKLVATFSKPQGAHPAIAPIVHSHLHCRSLLLSRLLWSLIPHSLSLNQ